MASTARLAKDLLSQKTFLEEINTRMQPQSGILNTITRNNNEHNACMKAMEGRLADGNARLMGLHTTMEATTSSLCTDINDIHARLIPDLRHDIKHEFSKALAHVPFLAANNPILPEGTGACILSEESKGTGVPPGGKPDSPLALAAPPIQSKGTGTSQANATTILAMAAPPHSVQGDRYFSGKCNNSLLGLGG